MGKRIALDKNKVVSMYIDDMLSARKIGGILGVSRGPVLEILKDSNIHIRNSIDNKVANNTYKNKEWLVGQYIVKEKSANNISKECGVCIGTILRHIDKYDIPRHQRKYREDLSGQRFGRLLVLRMKEKRSDYGAIMYLCECECGNLTSVLAGNLKSGHSRSCGCLSRDMKAARHGTNSPVWNPDLTDEERGGRRDYKEYKEWRSAVYERDNCMCQKCGEIGGQLNAHHIESYSMNKDLRITLENGITLCKDCHDNFHHIYGYKNTREQFDEFMLMENCKDVQPRTDP